MIPLHTQQITEKDSRTKGMYCKQYVCSTNPSSLNHFNLLPLVVGSIISLGKGLFNYQIECCFLAGPQKSLECCFTWDPHVRRGFMNWKNLIIMKDQQIHSNFIGAIFIVLWSPTCFGHLRGLLQGDRFENITVFLYPSCYYVFSVVITTSDSCLPPIRRNSP